MDEHYLKNVVEAALLASGRPLTLDNIRELFDERERPDADQVRAAITALETDYAERGIEVREISSGFRIQVRGNVGEHISRLWQERPGKYSRAMLETLALIAYRQPITRAEIEEIRGVGVNQNILRSFFERGWVRVVGHRQVPGHPELLGTTKEFLDYFNLKSLEDLPTLAELRDMDNVGVQLELPSGDTPPAGAAETPAPDDAEQTVPETAEQGDTQSSEEEAVALATEDSTDDDGTEDEDAPETLQTQGLVASSPDEAN
jgi:segregation and condensation protein B